MSAVVVQIDPQSQGYTVDLDGVEPLELVNALLIVVCIDGFPAGVWRLIDDEIHAMVGQPVIEVVGRDLHVLVVAVPVPVSSILLAGGYKASVVGSSSVPDMTSCGSFPESITPAAAVEEAPEPAEQMARWIH